MIIKYIIINLFNNKINIISLVLYINKQRGLINI